MGYRNEPECVRKKWEIQQRIMQDYDGVPAEVAREAQRRRIAEDSIPGPYLQKVPLVPRLSMKPPA